MTSPIKTIVYDWNGTLFDDTEAVLKGLNAALAKFEAPALTMETYRSAYDLPPARFAKNLGFAEARIPLFLQMNRDHFHPTYETEAEKASLRPEVRALLSRLRKEGYRQLILSNHIVSRIEKQLLRFDIRSCFDVILANPTPNEFVQAVRKSDRLAAYIQENQLEPKETLIIGDTTEEAHIAKEMGLVSVLISGGSMNRERLAAAQPDHLIDQLDELLPILGKRSLAS